MARFCRRITELHHGAMVTVQLHDAQGNARPLAEEQPLRSFTLDDKTEACNDVLLIETGAGGPGMKVIEHRIVEPIYLRLKNGENDRYNRVQILAESGMTVIMLNPGLHQEMAKEFGLAGSNASRQPR